MERGAHGRRWLHDGRLCKWRDVDLVLHKLANRVDQNQGMLNWMIGKDWITLHNIEEDLKKFDKAERETQHSCKCLS